ncbi:MAG: methyltransferase domain-containing protein [Vulcanimicrobiaceae bacterium]
MSNFRPNRSHATQLANDAIAQGEPVRWFESFYQAARGNPQTIPWADLEPNPNLVEWYNRSEVPIPSGASCLVVGCGLGDDANYLAADGARVAGFDISPTAVAWAAQRFSGANLEFFVADVLNLPDHLSRAFDLVVEIYTLQVLPVALRAPALESLADCVRGAGRLLIICRGRDDDEPFGELPWGVSKRELQHVESLGLSCSRFEDYIDPHTGSRRFRAVYERLG